MLTGSHTVANVGDAGSLVSHPASTTHSQMDKHALELAGLTEDMIRCSVGLADMEDIMNDFDNGSRASQNLPSKLLTEAKK